ncbi:MAG: hypothetical protein AABY01_03770 [Nanoarchaeota archaeon]
MKKPYIGVTGPTSVEEVDSILGSFLDAGLFPECDVTPMVGFLVSYKTMNGQATENLRYPPVASLPALVAATRDRALPTIHYNSREQNLAGQVKTLFGPLKGLCKTVQLNVSWPEFQQVAAMKYHGLDIILQLSQGAMEGKTPVEIANKVASYGHNIDYVLIDPSGGKGKEFDMDRSQDIWSALTSQCIPLTIGFAGGFTGENVRGRVHNLRMRGAEKFSIDAEGGLRDKKSNAYGDDTFNAEKTAAYIKNAVHAFHDPL